MLVLTKLLFFSRCYATKFNYKVTVVSNKIISRGTKRALACLCVCVCVCVCVHATVSLDAGRQWVRWAVPARSRYLFSRNPVHVDTESVERNSRTRFSEGKVKSGCPLCFVTLTESRA